MPPKDEKISVFQCKCGQQPGESACCACGSGEGAHSGGKLGHGFVSACGLEWTYVGTAHPTPTIPCGGLVAGAPCKGTIRPVELTGESREAYLLTLPADAQKHARAQLAAK